MNIPRRTFIHLTAGAVALPAVSRLAWATDPIRRSRCASSSAFAAGTGADILARLMAQWLTERLGQQFVIDNRPGGGGNVGTEAVVKATPDGYTLLQIVTGQHDQRHALRQASPSISSATSRPSRALRACRMLWWSIHRPRSRPCRSSLPMRRPIPASSTTPRRASARGIHMSGELFKMMAGVEHGACAVPGRGRRDHRSDRRPGAVDVRHHRRRDPAHQGRQAPRACGDHHHALGAAARAADRRRLRAGLRGRAARSGIGAPRNTPTEIIERLNKEINAALADPKAKARLAELGGEPLTGSAAEFGQASSRPKPRNGPRSSAPPTSRRSSPSIAGPDAGLSGSHPSRLAAYAARTAG